MLDILSIKTFNATPQNTIMCRRFIEFGIENSQDFRIMYHGDPELIDLINTINVGSLGYRITFYRVSEDTSRDIKEQGFWFFTKITKDES